MKKANRLTPAKLLGGSVVGLYSLALLIPFAFVIVTAFKSENELVLNPIGFPMEITLNNFLEAWQKGNLLNALKNSVILSCSTTILVLINVVLVAYCVNRIRRFKISNVIYLFFLAAMFVPNVGNATLLTMRRQWGLYNNLLGEIVMGSLSITTGVFLVSGFLRTIPTDLEEAARIDGANDFQTCLKVIVPVIKPVLVTVAILQFTSTWNNALGPMMTLRDPELYTIPLALLMNFPTMSGVENTKVFAGVLITSIPVVILFIKCQKYFITAMAGSVKG